MKLSWLTRTFRALFLLGAVLSALLVGAAAGLWWWAGSEGSLDWMLRQIARSQPLQVEGAQGSLRSGLRVKRLLWSQGGIEVEALDVRAEWKPLALLSGEIKIEQAHAALIRVQDRRPPQRSEAPQSLAIRLYPTVDELKVGRIEWSSPATTFAATDLAGSYRYRYDQHQVQLDSLRWGGGNYHGRASVGAHAPLQVDTALAGEFQATVPQGAAQVPLTFTATLRGPLTELQAHAVLQVAPGSASSGTQATATARITPWAAQPVPQAQAEFRQLDLGALWPQQSPRTRLAGQLQVQPAGTATWTVRVDVTNELAGPWDQGRLPVDQLNAQGEWRQDGAALVRSLEARLGGGKLQAQGQWRGSDGWAVGGRIQGVDPAALYSAMAPLPLSGSIDLKGEGAAIAFDVDLKAANGKAVKKTRGRPAAATADLAATLRALELRQGAARGRWHDGLLTLPMLDIRTSDATLRGALEVRPATRAGSGRLSLEAPGMQARAEGRLAQAQGGGSAQLAINNAGQAMRWAQRLPASPAASRDLDLAGRGEVQITWQGGWADPVLQGRLASPLLEIRDAAAPRSDGSAAAPRWLVRDAQATLNGRLSDAQLDASGRAELGRRRLALELSGRGGRRAQTPAIWWGQVAKLNVSASDPSLGAGSWTLALQRPFDLRWQGNSFEAGASAASLIAPRPGRSDQPAATAPAVLAWEPVRLRNGELHTAGRLTGLPLAWIELMGGPQLAGSAVTGDMVFDAQWDASLGDTPRLRATLARSRGDVTVLAETAQGTPARVRAGVREASLSLASEGEALTLTLKWDSERGGTADGRIATRLARGGAAGWHWPEDAPLTGALRAQLPRIAVWSLLAPPGWRLRGSLGADIAVAGTRAQPRLTGTLVADDLALRSVVDGVELQGGRLRARLDGQRLLIDEFMLRGAGGAAGGGMLVATGEGAWTGDGPQARISAQLTRLRASIRSDRQLTVSGRIDARVDRSGTEVSGDLKVDQAHLQLPDQSTPALGDDVVVRRGHDAPLTKTEARASEQAQAQGSRRLKIAIDLDLGQDFRVEGRGIDTRMRGNLALTGESVAAPRLTGSIRTDGGEYRAYGQRLDIERGVLRFTGAIDNPALDILAIRPRLTQRVGVQVTGTALSPFVRLYAEPDLPEVEKLSWLVLGRASASGGAEAALLQQATLALLASRSGDGKRGMVASLGLDELSFRRDGPDGPAITLGRRLGRNLYASYERSLSGALGTLYLFYDLTQRVKVRAEAGERTAVDLIITLTFD